MRVSLGGSTTAEDINADSRVNAGINLDGTIFNPVFIDGLDRPVPAHG
jgi:hypothetical protein